MKRRTFMALAGVALTATMLAACGSEGGGGGLNDADDPLPTSAVPTPTRISPEQMNQQMTENAGYGMLALAFEDPAQAAAGYQAEDGTRLVAVQVELDNVSSDDAMTVDIANAVVTDDKGIDYTAVAGARDGEIAAGELNQGEKASGWIAFRVPADANLQSVTYRIGILTTVALTADLPK